MFIHFRISRRPAGHACISLAFAVLLATSHACRGQSDPVAQLMAPGPQCAPSDEGFTALHYAVMEFSLAQLTQAETLILGGANVNARSKGGATPLHLAAQLGNVQAISLLLANGALVDARTVGYTVSGDVGVGMVGDGSGLHTITRRMEVKCGGFTPLSVAVSNNQLSAAQMLLDHGADANTMEQDGAAPLDFAVDGGRKDLVELLLDHGANPNPRFGDPFTPLCLAVKKGFPEIAKLLISHGANPNSMDDSGDAPIHIAARAARKDLLELLVQGGADINLRNGNRRTPLWVVLHDSDASKAEKEGIAEFLRQHGGRK